jgi:hypothetical protein
MCPRICAWCKRVLGYVEPYEDSKPTHTICKACNKECFPEDEGGDACTTTDTLNTT